MRLFHPTLIALLTAPMMAALATGAQAQPAAAPMPGMAMPPSQGAAAPGGMAPVDAALMQSMQGMQHDMAAAPMTGHPDQDFVTMMIPHHEGAIAMAKVQLQYGRDAGMKALARRIIADQEKEVRQMKAWLAAHPAH